VVQYVSVGGVVLVCYSYLSARWALLPWTTAVQAGWFAISLGIPLRERSCVVATLKGTAALVQRLQDMVAGVNKDPVLKAGFLAGATYPDGTSVPEVAAANEFGVPSRNQPPRPFFRNTLAAHRNEWPEQMGKRLLSTKYSADQVMNQMGLLIQSQIRDSIQQLRDPPLSPRTIAAKGFAKPLIDTGHMLNSVDYEIEGEK